MRGRAVLAKADVNSERCGVFGARPATGAAATVFLDFPRFSCHIGLNFIS